jgi:hypothetical protein
MGVDRGKRVVREGSYRSRRTVKVRKRTASVASR